MRWIDAGAAIGDRVAKGQVIAELETERILVNAPGAAGEVAR